MDYLSIPLVLREGYLDRTNLRESIVYSIGLLLSSRPGILPFNPNYGCDIWDREYSDLLAANKGEIRASLRNAINNFEKRLYEVSVSFTTSGTDPSRHLGLVVRVTANYREEGEEKRFDASFNIG